MVGIEHETLSDGGGVLQSRGRMKEKIILGLVVLLAFFVRFYRLDVVPSSINWDEASVLWNAHLLAKTGSDEFANSFPVSIRSFEDFKPPLLTYAATGSVFLFGVSEWAVRLPSALAGTATVAMIYFLVREKKLALLAALFLAVSPWHLVFSRIAFEASLALFLFTSAVFFLVRFLSRCSSLYFLLSIFLFALAFYTHHSVRLAFPLFLGGVLLFNFRFFIVRWRLVLLGFVLAGVLLAPLFYSNWRYQSLRARFGQTSIFYSPGLRDVAKLFVEKERLYWADDQKNKDALGKISHNSLLVYGKLFLRNFVDHFNFDFLYLTGDNNPRHRIPDVGTLLLLQLPFVVVGAYFLVRKRPAWASIVGWWFLVAPVASALTTETPHASRAFLFIVPYQIIAAYGVLEILRLAGGIVRPIIVSILAVLYITNVFYVSHMYFIHLPIEDASAWQYGYKQAVDWVNRNGKDYQKIYVTKYYDQPYIYFLLYGGFPPTLKNDGTFSDGFNRFRFVNFGALPEEEFVQISHDDLLILSPFEFQSRVKTLEEIKFPDGRAAFRIAQRL